MFRLCYLIKFIPNFIKLRKENIVNIKIFTTYSIINILSILLSIWIISRMILLSNFIDLYIISLLLSFIVSIIVFNKYNKNLTEFNYNIKRYPIWMISMFGIIIFVLWLVIPMSVMKIMESYSNILYKYNIFENKSLIMSMSNTPDNVSSTVRSNIQNPESILEKEIPRGTSKSISTTNSVTHIVDTSANTEAGDGGVAKAVSSASLVNTNDVSKNQDSISIQEVTRLDTPLWRPTSPIVFANPSVVSYESLANKVVARPTLSESELKIHKIKNLGIKNGTCKTTLLSELLFSSKFTFLNGNNISKKVISHYLDQYPGYPKMGKIPGSSYCRYVFYMNLSNSDLHTLYGCSIDYINGNFPLNPSITTIYKLTQSYNEIIYLLKYPGFLEKWYYYNNILDKIIASDEYDKFVSQEDTRSILLNINKRKNSAAHFSVTWLNNAENVGSYQLNLSDLEIKFFYDLRKIKIFLNNDISKVISLDYFLKLKNNMILNDLICNYFYKYVENDVDFTEDGNYQKFYITIMLENLKIEPSLLDRNLELLRNLHKNFVCDYSSGCICLSETDYSIYKYKMELENSSSLNIAINKEKSMSQLNIKTSTSSNKIRIIKKAISSIFIKK